MVLKTHVGQGEQADDDDDGVVDGAHKVLKQTADGDILGQHGDGHVEEGDGDHHGLEHRAITLTDIVRQRAHVGVQGTDLVTP